MMVDSKARYIMGGLAFIASVSVAAVVLSGCGDDSDPVAGGGSQSDSGTETSTGGSAGGGTGGAGGSMLDGGAGEAGEDGGAGESGSAGASPDAGACEPVLPTGWTPPAYVPATGAHQNVCTEQQMADAFLCNGAGVPQVGSCSTSPEDTACADCLVTPSTDPKLGALIEYASGIDPNLPGCLELKGYTECAEKYGALVACLHAACEPACSDSVAEKTSCFDAAHAGPCAPFLDDAAACVGALPSASVRDCFYKDLLDAQAIFGRLFCGPETAPVCAAYLPPGYVAPQIAIQPQAHQGACTEALLGEYFAACLGSSGSAQACSAFANGDAAHKTCRACLYTPDVGPLVKHPNNSRINIPACLAAIGDTSCAQSVYALVRCQAFACMSCTGPGTTATQVSDCWADSDAAGCEPYVDDNNECLSDPAASACVGDTSQELFMNVAGVLCGP
jgi:hypothetical protein